MFVVVRDSISASDVRHKVTNSAPASRNRAAKNINRQMKVSIPTPFGQYYLTLNFGAERRAADRLVEEEQTKPEKISVVYTVLLWNFFGIICLGVMVAIYIAKSVMGINLFPTDSFLHNFLYPDR